MRTPTPTVDLSAVLAGTQSYAPWAAHDVRAALAGETLMAAVALPAVSADSEHGVRTDLQVVALTATTLLFWYGSAGETPGQGYMSTLNVVPKAAVTGVDINIARNEDGRIDNIAVVVHAGGGGDYHMELDLPVLAGESGSDDDVNITVVEAHARLTAEGLAVVASRTADGDDAVDRLAAFGFTTLAWARA